MRRDGWERAWIRTMFVVEHRHGHARKCLQGVPRESQTKLAVALQPIQLGLERSPVLLRPRRPARLRARCDRRCAGRHSWPWSQGFPQHCTQLAKVRVRRVSVYSQHTIPSYPQSPRVEGRTETCVPLCTQCLLLPPPQILLVGRLILRPRACTRGAATGKGLVLKTRQIADVHPPLQRTHRRSLSESAPRL